MLPIAKSLGRNLSPKCLQNFSTSQQKCQNIGNHLWNLKSGPPPALALGAAGLIPFVSAPAYMVQINEFVPLIAQGNCYSLFLGTLTYRINVQQILLIF